MRCNGAKQKGAEDTAYSPPHCTNTNTNARININTQHHTRGAREQGSKRLSDGHEAGSCTCTGAAREKDSAHSPAHCTHASMRMRKRERQRSGAVCAREREGDR